MKSFYITKRTACSDDNQRRYVDLFYVADSDRCTDISHGNGTLTMNTWRTK